MASFSIEGYYGRIHSIMKTFVIHSPNNYDNTSTKKDYEMKTGPARAEESLPTPTANECYDVTVPPPYYDSGETYETITADYD